MVTCKWLFKHKYHVVGTIAKYKTRLVPTWFSQVEGFDYGGTFFLMVKISFLCIFIALIAIYDYHIHQMDVQTTFMQQPPGYICWSRNQDVLIIENL